MNTLEEILNDLRLGKIVVVLDDEDRENEGDLIMAAQFATPEAVNFMARYGRGLICAALSENQARRFGLEVPPAVVVAGKPLPPLQGTRFTQSVDYIHGTTTGISAYDRSATLQALADEKTQPHDFASPGHLFPLIAVNGGLAQRRGHTEATVDLCRWSQSGEVGVLCEILNEDGTMARKHDLVRFCQTWNLKWTTIPRIIQEKEQLCTSSKEILTPADTNLPWSPVGSTN